MSGNVAEIVPAFSRDSDFAPLFQRQLVHVREEVADNPYIEEAIRVLSVQGYRSAIGCFWNAVVDDLRNRSCTGACRCSTRKRALAAM